MSRSRAHLQFICVYNIRYRVLSGEGICVPWGGRGCRDPKVRWWDASYLAMWPGVCSLSRRVSVTYDVKSSSGVVVGVCGTWCAAWDGFFVPCSC